MGIYDREYYRDDSRGSGFFSGVAPACKTLILINAAVFLILALVQDAEGIILGLAAIPRAIFQDLEVYRLLTATFLHVTPSTMGVDLFGLVFLMLALWMIGRELEMVSQSREFASFYLTAAVLSTLGWALTDTALGTGEGKLVGSAGPVVAIFVLYTLLDPRREGLLFGFIRLEARTQLLVFLGLVAGLEYMATGGGRPFAIALSAYATAGAYAYLYRTFDLRWSRLLGGVHRRRPSLRVYTPDVRDRDKVAPLTPSTQVRPTGVSQSRPMSGVALAEEQLDARLDEVLAKIAREGRGGLTEEENRVLQEASRRARNRRSDRL